MSIDIDEIAAKHAARLWNSSSCPAQAIIADAINEALAEQRWIPVSERLPEPDLQVLWWPESGNVFVECIDHDGSLEDLQKCLPNEPLTHWRPVPAPPEET